MTRKNKFKDNQQLYFITYAVVNCLPDQSLSGGDRSVYP